LSPPLPYTTLFRSEPAAALGAGDRHDVVALRVHPGERQLAGRHALLARDLLDLGDQLQVAREVLALEARREAPVVVGREVLEAAELAGEEAAPERAVGDEADPELPARGEHAVLGITGPQRVLALERADRVHRAGAPQRLDAGLREPEEAHLARLHQLRHRAHRLLDGRLGIDAV